MSYRLLFFILLCLLLWLFWIIFLKVFKYFIFQVLLSWKDNILSNAYFTSPEVKQLKLAAPSVCVFCRYLSIFPAWIFFFSPVYFTCVFALLQEFEQGLNVKQRECLSQNPSNRMVEAGRNLWRWSCPQPLLKKVT